MSKRIYKLLVVLLFVATIWTTGCQTGGWFGRRDALTQDAPATSPAQTIMPAAYTASTPEQPRNKPFRFRQAAADNCAFG